MNDSRFSPGQVPPLHQSTAGIIKRIRLENFMCHSNLEIEPGEWVTFVTGQNGSGKSAILTALCVAFGCRAKGTQRASTLKEFIKTGCSNAVIHVEIKNEGEDAFKPEIYGDVIIVERRISESTSSTMLKNYQGKTVVSRRLELQEIVEHFNIDVENPCVIMTQDKSREFLHSGNNKDKFKATLLEQVGDLLESISKQLEYADGVIGGLEAAIRPVEKELNELQVKIRNMEHVEQIALEVQQLRKKLAWSLVYDVDKQVQEQGEWIDKLKDRIPICQAKIDQQLDRIKEFREHHLKKKAEIDSMVKNTSEVNQRKEDLENSFSLAMKAQLGLEQDYKHITSSKEKLVQRLKRLEQQVQDIHEQHDRNTQAEESEVAEKLEVLQNEVHETEVALGRLREEETILADSIQRLGNEIMKIAEKLEEHERRCDDISKNIRFIQQHQTNKVSAFGGDKVINLLRIIERCHYRFNSPPIGPIGAHLNLRNADKWAVAVEYAIGKMLNSFIVTDHKDFLLLKQCAKEANYGHLQIIIYDFSRPRLTIPQNMLPETEHPSTLSILDSENHTVINVLVDLGNVERQVLVQDYDEGKVVAFEQRIRNMKEVFTSDGCRMFSRGSVQTVLPPNKRQRTGRLCGALDDQMKNLQNDEIHEKKAANDCRRSKREAEKKLEDLDKNLKSVKKRCIDAVRNLSSKKLALEDHQFAARNRSSPSSSVADLDQEISELQRELRQKETLLEEHRQRMHDAGAKATEVKVKLDSLCESAKAEIVAYDKAGSELMEIERELQSAERKKAHFDEVMKDKVLGEIKKAEAHYLELKTKRKENSEKASEICCENELDSFDGRYGSNSAQLSAHLERLQHRLRRESERYSESIDDLRMLYQKKECKIIERQQAYKALREKLDACLGALELRKGKFDRNAALLKRQLSWQFNGHLSKKGISGRIKVNYKEKTLSIEVRMPQDASGRVVQDTKGLSGGERSFSTLCFALALHEMTEATFRAMDEFDVFMDAVSRKISLDTLVDFAVAQGSQWILITPHDISMVKPGERIKKLQLAAPRS